MKKLLNVPYLTQTNNEHDPFGSCNVTSVAMCLLYRGIIGDGSHRQLEDQVYHRAQEINADRFTPEGIKKIIESYGRIDKLNTNGNLQDIRESIDADAPVIVHGFFTNPGHIIVIKGYDNDEKMFSVHDPYGEWHPWWYDTNTATKMKGKGLKYSYQAIASCCAAWDYNQAQVFYSDRSFKADLAKDMWIHSIPAN